MGNFLKSLFSSSEAETPAEVKARENRKKFDIFKYDGIRAQQTGRVQYAIKCYREALKIMEDTEVLQCLAAACAGIHETDGALSAMNRLVELEPENVNALLARANLFYQAEKGEEAIGDCLRAIESDASNPVAWYLMGKVKKSRKDLPGAIDDLTQAIALKQTPADAYLLRAEAWLETNRPDEALSDTENFIQLAPEEEAAYLLRGRIYERLEDLSAAAEDYNQAAILNPFCEEAYFLKGSLLMKEKKWNEAIALFDEVIELNPSFAESYRKRAKAKALKGDSEGAAEDERQAVALDAERKEKEKEEAGGKAPDFNTMYKGGIF
jgi:tetratricopeptide (TPR) repeat protein